MILIITSNWESPSYFMIFNTKYRCTGIISAIFQLLRWNMSCVKFYINVIEDKNQQALNKKTGGDVSNYADWGKGVPITLTKSIDILKQILLYKIIIYLSRWYTSNKCMLNIFVDLKDIIRCYHRRGLSHKEIHFLLKIRHGQNYRYVCGCVFI